jgi:hypothetical protein
MEDVMLKCFPVAIFVGLVAVGAGSAHAQQQAAMLQKLEVTGAGFDIVVATAKRSDAGDNVLADAESLVVSAAGGELAFAVDEDMQKMLKQIRISQYPIAVFHVDSKNGKQPANGIVYIVPRARQPLY